MQFAFYTCKIELSCIHIDKTIHREIKHRRLPKRLIQFEKDYFALYLFVGLV